MEEVGGGTILNVSGNNESGDQEKNIGKEEQGRTMNGRER